MQNAIFLGQKGIGFGSRFSRNVSTSSVLQSSGPRILWAVRSNITRNALLVDICRHYRAASKTAFRRFDCSLQNVLQHQTASRLFHVSSAQHYDRLQNLEDAANRDRDNANAQAVFFQV
jgi:hypothetical protein